MPHQLGYGVRLGAEAAAHAARLYLSKLTANKALLKLDFTNAFNTVRRDKMLASVELLAPSIFPFIHSVYSAPSSLFWDDRVIHSCEGIKQGDPLGPLLFCLSIHHLLLALHSELSMSYLDDISLGGDVEDISNDLVMFKQGAKDVGLQLNPNKCEIISVVPDSQNSILSLVPGSRIVNLSMATLLGSPLGDVPGISSVLTEKTNLLKIMAVVLSSHSTMLLITTTSAVRCCSQNNYVQHHLSNDHSAWTQAVLLVRHGGLGIRSAVRLAPSAYLASAAASSTLVHQILLPQFSDTDLLCFQEALALWTNSSNQSPPEGITSYHQKSWDIPTILAIKENLLNSATNESSKSRLLAAFSEESGIWLNALPLSSLGLRMDDSTFQIAVSLRLGLAFCKPHSCHHCGCEVTAFATHGLSCVKSQGRYRRHSSLNDIIHRAFGASRIPSRLEPSGISRSDAELHHRRQGQWLTKLRNGNSTNMDPNMYLFAPVVIETSGVFGKQTLLFLKDLACRFCKVSGEVKSLPYLLQCLAVAVQRGNAVSVLGTFVSEDCLVFEDSDAYY
ncbi:hypothetical protein EMCRGX_G011871 [Ephydatia muelleri]